MEKRVLWFIDENEGQRLTYSRVLQRLVEDSAEVKAIEPFASKADYLPILQHSHTVCIVIDEKLKDTGVASYFGIELAQYIRGVNQKLPIYILTNYPNAVASSGLWSVEDIIDKGNLDDDQESQILKARLLRRIDVYEDILLERQKRFQELLRKSLKDELTRDEITEFEKLQLTRTSPILAEELEYLADLEELVEEHKRILESLTTDGDNDAN